MRPPRYVSWGLQTLFFLSLLGCAPVIRGGTPITSSTGDGGGTNTVASQGVEIEPGIVTPPARPMVVFSGGGGE